MFADVKHIYRKFVQDSEFLFDTTIKIQKELVANVEFLIYRNFFNEHSTQKNSVKIKKFKLLFKKSFQLTYTELVCLKMKKLCQKKYIDKIVLKCV